MRCFTLTFSIVLLIGCLVSCTTAAQTVGTPVNVYTRSDACGAAQTWAVYLGDYHQEDLLGTAVYGDPGLAEAVIVDALGIGYNNLNYAYDMSSGRPVSGLAIIPLDTNADGRIDSSEAFYDDKKSLTAAIADGRFPSPPARDLNLVTFTEFKGLTRQFIQWILTDGQVYVDEVGYIALSSVRIEEALQALGPEGEGMEFEGTIAISGAWALYPMVVKWAEEFQKLHQGVNFDISAGGAGKGMADALGGLVDLGMVSREIYPQEIEKGAFWVSVTKDAVVPTASTENPYLQQIQSQGLSKEDFAGIWINNSITDWTDVIE